VSLAVLPSALQAQVFAPVPALSFTKPLAGIDPLRQTLTVASVGTGFNFTYAATTSTGGNWLSVASGDGCGLCATPETIAAIVTANITLAAGSYSGQIVLTSQSGSVTLTIPVTLTITSTSSAFLDNLPGQLSYSLKTGGAAITSQAIQVRNGGTGTLTWNATMSTSDGGSWLHISSSSGTAPSPVTVSITVANLPGAGATQGSFIGQLVFTTTASSTTIPVVVVVGNSILSQINGINFTKVFSGANPLPQTLTVANTGTTAFNFTSAAYTATGGSWFSIATGDGCGLCAAPETIDVSIAASPTLAVGTYTGEIIITNQVGSMSLTVPVSLTVSASGTDFFDNLPGQLSYTMVTSGTSITSQTIQVRDGGTASLSWTLTGSTSDTGNWLTISNSSGVTPALITIGISVANLPNGGLVAQTYIGQLVFQSTSGGSYTVPISVVVGNAAFSQINGINFTKVFGGANPLPQTLTVPSNGSTFNFSAAAFTATGGSWLTIGTGDTCGLCATPETINVSITASPTLAVGTYTGEIIITSQAGSMSLTVPVTLTVVAASTPFFDNLPGQLSFTLLTNSSNNPPAQSLQIRNGTTGSLDWTLTTSTADGGNWLSASATSGTATSLINISVSKSNVPGSGLTAGTFNGQIVLRTSFGNSVTIPVSFVVGASVFNQVNPITFTKLVGGANPLPQTLTISSSGATFNFTAAAFTGTGGSWLTIATGDTCGLCAAPETINVSITASPTLAAGTYTGEIIVTSQVGNMSLTVPVTFTVAASGTPFFDDVPGQLSFTLLTGSSGNPPAQSLQIRNGASGSLDWTLAASTADGGNWLNASVASGTAPSVITVSVQKSNLPGLGLIAGTFVGQVVFNTSFGNSVTIPISFVVGTSVFNQVNAISFTKPFSGANPLPQVLTIMSTGTAFNFTSAAFTGTGGTWFTITTGDTCGLCATPETINVTITASPTLAVGTYTGEIIVTSQSGSMSITVPVTLSVEAQAGAPFFDNLPGQMSFSFQTGSSGPPSQTVQVRSDSPGALNWTLATTTSDGGNWLSPSATSGTAPSTVTIGIIIANLPGQGLIAGSFSGELVFSSATGSVTIPVSVTVGTSVFSQLPGLVFSKTYGGADPLPQTISVASTSANFNFLTAFATGNGGAWLSVVTVGSCGLCTTPHSVTVSIVASSTLGAGTYTGQIVFTQQSGTMAMTVPVTLTVGSTALQFYSIPPCRLVDTRVGQGKSGAFGPPALAASSGRDFPLLSGGCSIPSTAQAYSLNFTVVPSGPLGFLSVWPVGDPYPGVSTLNSIDGSVIANAAIVPAGTSGSITALASNPTDLIIDINGYFAPAAASGLDFFPLTPCRIADTRTGQGKTGAFGPPSLAGFVTRDFPLATSPCLSGSEQAYSLNVTAVPPGPLGFLSIWPVGQPYPGVSTLNSPDATALANAAIVPAGTGGDINLLAGNPTDVILDINGKFATPGAGGLQFYAVTPCRVADTRTGQGFTGAFGPPSLAAFADRDFPIQSSPCGIPATVQAYALNMTVVPPGPLGFLSAWPSGQAYPGVSTLNSPDGYVIANAAIVPAGTGAAISVVAGNPTDLIIDIVGYFAP